MKILHVGWGYPPENFANGTSAYVEELCEELAFKGHKNILLAASPMRVDGGLPFSIIHRTYNGLDIYGITNRHVQLKDLQQPMREMQNPESERAFQRIVDEVDPDVVHFHKLAGLSASLLDVANQFAIPSVVSLHDYWPICPRSDLFNDCYQACPGPGNGGRCAQCIPSNNGDASLEKRAAMYATRRRTIMRWLGEADAVIATSGYIRDVYADHGLPESNTQTIHCGAKTAEELWAATRRQPWRLPDVLTFGFIGSICRRKAPHLLIEAATMLTDLEPRFRISIHGTIADRHYALEIEERLLSLNGRLPEIEFAGYYKPQMLKEILGKFDVCVVPPAWPDCAPRTAMEALGARVPVIASMSGGLTEVVGHGYNGLLFESGSATSLAEQMRHLIENPIVVAHFKSSIMPPKQMVLHAGEIESIYNSVISRASAAVPELKAA